MNSGRAIIIYGQPGSGKTFIAEHLTRLMHDFVAIPYAITVDNEIIQIFDPHVHQLMPQKSDGAQSRPQESESMRAGRPAGGRLRFPAAS